MTESIIFKLSDGTELKNGDTIFYFAEAGAADVPIKSYDKFPSWDPILLQILEAKFEFAVYDNHDKCFKIYLKPPMAYENSYLEVLSSEWMKTFFISEAAAESAKKDIILSRTFSIPYFLDKIKQCDINIAVKESIGHFSDGYHTFGELYSHRTALLASLVKTLPDKMAWKSKKHSDGTMFDDMFIVGIDLLEGTISYHVNLFEENGTSNWELFQCKELDKAPVWDGYTPNDVVERLRKFASSPDIKTQINDTDDYGYMEVPCVNDNIPGGTYKVIGRLHLDTRKCSCGCDHYKVIRVVDPEIVSEKNTVGYSVICERCFKEFCYL